MKDWHKLKPELFRKQPYYRPGCDNYLKVVMDEVFGRRNFVVNNVWQKRYSRDGRGIIGDAHEHIFCYAKDTEKLKASRNLVPLAEKQRKLYKNPDNDPRGPWQSVSLLAQGYRPNQMYEITAPNGNVHRPAEGTCWKVVKATFDELIEDDRITFGTAGNGVPRRKYFLSEVSGMVPWSWWPHEDVGHTGESKNEIVKIFGSEIFNTPKPERLIQRILHIATNPGDLVLDSFLGSGTTAAVAHKMGRRWIGVEMGEHARSHCALRLQKVIDGEQGGISQDVTWQGGGGFRFCTLGQAVFDAEGRIDPAIRFADLARHIWFSETRQPLTEVPTGPLLGVHDARAVALLYNGILRDRSAQGGNVLTRAVLRLIREDLARAAPDFAGDLVVYGAACRLSEATLKEQGIVFRQTPYDISARV
jgi:adenine-specific DNA-methyltransferase